MKPCTSAWNRGCLSGGSAYGLDTATGVMRYLEEKSIGFPIGGGVVPRNYIPSVEEGVINALKHAFPGRLQKGRIEVDYSRSDGAWSLSVDDDGSGMAAEEDAKPGLGAGIVAALARQLNAEVQTESSDQGTRVSIVHTE